MNSSPPAKRIKRLDRSASPASPFAVFSIDDFDEASSSTNTDVAKKIAPSHPENKPLDLLQVVDNAIVNMVDLMKECGFNPMYETTRSVRISEEENALLAERALENYQQTMRVAEANFVTIRNISTRAGLEFKYHLKEPLSGEPPLLNPDYHQLFLRTPVQEWERACCMGDQCEGNFIVNCGKPLCEFLLPDDKRKLDESLEAGQTPELPERVGRCLLCDRMQTSLWAAEHEAGNPLYNFTDQHTREMGNVKLFSANGYPLTINSHQVFHGEPGGYLSERLISSNHTTKVPGLVGHALEYIRADYVGNDHMEEDGCIWIDQSRLLFPIASIAH